MGKLTFYKALEKIISMENSINIPESEPLPKRPASVPEQARYVSVPYSYNSAAGWITGSSQFTLMIYYSIF